MNLREKIEQLRAGLLASCDFKDEFYLTYIGLENDGDISDWHNNHFDDNIQLGEQVGQTMATASIIEMLSTILEETE